MTGKHGKRMRSLMRAIPFEERIKLAANSAPGTPISGREAAYARKVISRWKGRVAFKDATFSAWLARYGISEPQLAHMVRMRASAAVRVNIRHHPLWRSLASLRSHNRTAESSPPHEGHDALLHLVQPLVDEALRTLRDELSHLSASGGARHFETELVLQICRRDIARQMVYLIQKTCLLELQVAGLRGDLAGADSAQRYRSFIDRIANSAGREALFLEYPLLLDLVVTRLKMYRRNVVELLMNLFYDAQAIELNLLAGNTLGKLQDWEFGNGDSHCEGRSVTKLTFSGDVRLVYKPRSLRIDEGFSELLAWCNTQLPTKQLRGVRVLDCGSHGWCEFIPHRELQSKEEARDFFHRQGKFLALFYVLHAGDLHHENMIACASDPVYIDLETLFHPQMFPSAEDGTWSDGWPMTVADTLIVSSSRSLPGINVATPDISIFGAYPAPGVSISLPRLVHAGTDRAGFEQREIAFEENDHIPVLDSELLAAEHYAGEINDGFVEMYRMLAAQVPYLTSSDGISKLFCSADVRLVFRPTQVYAALIDTALHPDYLCDALERRIFFEQLHVTNTPDQWRNHLLASEIGDLERLDVPYFVQAFDKKQVRNSCGETVHGLHLPSPKHVVFKHMSMLGEADLRSQLAVIDAALRPLGEPASTGTGKGGAVRNASESVTEFAARIASEIADRLLATMVVRGDDHYWLCQTATESGKVVVTPGIVNLYDGQLGIAIFLAEAARVLHREDCAEAALAALRTVRRWSHDGYSNFSFLGVFTGALGLPYALARVGAALGNDEASAAAVELLSAFDPNRPTAGGLDMIEGAAGGVVFLGAMLHQLEQNGSPCLALRRLMERLAERLVQTAIPQTKGIGWKPQAPNQRALTGFAHGNAGYSAALYVAARYLENPKYQEFARAAIVYENSCFSPEEHWFDLREQGPNNHVVHNKRMCAWCSGSTGILLGRLLCLNAIKPWNSDATFLIHDARRAAGIAWAEHELSSAGNLSLCHGAMGNLDIIRFAAQQPELRKIIPDDACREWIGGDNREWRCGDAFTSLLHAPTAAPGLMTGLSGIGLGLLRQISAKVPSVLALEVFTHTNALKGSYRAS